MVVGVDGNDWRMIDWLSSRDDRIRIMKLALNNGRNLTLADRSAVVFV